MRIKTFLFIFLFLLALFGLQINLAQAAGATFSISPASGEFTMGKKVTATVYLHTGGNLINAAEATLNFSPNVLNAVEISKTNSIFSFWPIEPTFDNNQGTITFGGGNPVAFSGSSGALLNITFYIKKVGEGVINFSGGRILLADGSGTNVLAGSQGASWRLIVPLPKPAIQLPPAPIVSSPTHPEPEKWYSNNNLHFIWDLPKDVTAVRVLYDQFPDTEPNLFYRPAISERKLGGVVDGIWYFLVQFQNARGWGKTGHFKVQIDTVPPEPFVIQFLDDKETYNSYPRIDFLAEDKFSGIARYEMKIGDGDKFDPEILKIASYRLPLQAPGEHDIVVSAFDKAENVTEAKDRFVILARPGIRLIDILQIVILVVLIIFILLGYRFWKFKRKIHKKIHETEQLSHKTFDVLKEKLEKRIKYLEEITYNRKLTEEEEIILEQLRTELSQAEKSIKKSVGRIER